jgi:23S rRNA (cytosine1962-C5)-methyltransferase
LTIEEEGLRFRVDLAAGQKTGFYLDQRENRLLVRTLSAGRRCFDACCYTGAFALNMARGGASSVTGLDVSENALALARENAALNGLTSVGFARGDVFKDLQARADAGARYDLLVLDPPRFAQSSRGVGQALKGYLHLNEQAIRCLAPSGILVTCSCSGRVSREEFRSMITLAAAQSGRRVRILRQSGQAMDHPVAAGCPESEYLKCFFCAVD